VWRSLKLRTQRRQQPPPRPRLMGSQEEKTPRVTVIDTDGESAHQARHP
jgi:hypothetical protein